MLIIDSVYVLFVNQHLPTSFSFCGNKSKSSGSPYGSSGWITSCWRPGEKKKQARATVAKMKPACHLKHLAFDWLYIQYIFRLFVWARRSFAPVWPTVLTYPEETSPKTHLFINALQSEDFWKRRKRLRHLIGYQCKCACSHQRRNRFQSLLCILVDGQRPRKKSLFYDYVQTGPKSHQFNDRTQVNQSTFQ